jgi:hypothetical protein
MAIRPFDVSTSRRPDPAISTAPFEVRTVAPAPRSASVTAPFDVRTWTAPATPVVVTAPLEVRRSRAAPGGTSTTALAARLFGDEGFGW